MIMDHAFVVRGSLSDPMHIVLEEPIAGIRGVVEVVVRAAPSAAPPAQPLRQQAWEAAFDARVRGHDRSVPLPSPDALRREASQ
jgi:hypothetical protein